MFNLYSINGIQQVRQTMQRFMLIITLLLGVLLLLNGVALAQVEQPEQSKRHADPGLILAPGQPNPDPVKRLQNSNVSSAATIPNAFTEMPELVVPVRPLDADVQIATSNAPGFDTKNTGTPIYFGPTAVGIIYYVKPVAGGSGSGADWANASGDLQAMINAAGAGDQVWVAAGLYKPTTGTDRDISFVMKDGVAIYGGFAGIEPSTYDLSLRDFDANQSILSGDLLGDDGQQPIAANASTNTNTGDNSFTVVDGSGVGSAAVLDGFYITAGNANVNDPYPSPHARGAGMFINTGAPTVTNCRFSGNAAPHIGGASIYMTNGAEPNISECSFSGNTGYQAGGIQFNLGSNPTITYCDFNGNTVTGLGGAITGGNGNLTMSYCNFTNNTGGFGGGVFLDEGTGGSMTHCLYSSNKTPIVQDAQGGGLVVNPSCTIAITACTFTNNQSPFGGGMMSWSGISISDCIFNGNSAVVRGGGIYNTQHADLTTIDNCTFSNNQGGFGGGLANDLASAQVTNCTFNGNSIIYQPNGSGGGISNRNSSQTTVSNSSFINNVNNYYPYSSPNNGNGGGISNETSNPTISECVFQGNVAFNRGGGIYNYNNASPEITACDFLGNQAYYGGGIGNDNATPTISNCAFNGNVAGNYGGGASNFNNTFAVITDCSFSENQALFGGGLINFQASSQISGCFFTGNSINGAGGAGGGMAMALDPSTTVTNTIFSNNTATGTEQEGGGLIIQDATPLITNTTIAGNSAVYGGAVRLYLASNPIFTNTIVYGNPTANGASILFEDGISTATFSYSLLEEGACYPEAACGDGMIYGQDPLFVSADDFHLQTGSPAINAGTNTGAPSIDIEGNPRALTVADPADMGAYEYTGPLVVPFEVFTVDELKIEVNSFKIEGNFTPASTIDPLTEDVTLEVGAFALTIPAGSFELSKKGKFEFEGDVNGVGVKFEIHPLRDEDYYFEGDFEGVDLSGTVFPVDVTLTIGDDAGTTSFSGELEKDGSSQPVSGLPEDFVLAQNYPNPFNPTTEIRFALPEAANMSLRIYNVTGQLVKTLISGSMDAGYHSIQWDGVNENGAKVSSGIYIYRITAGSFIQTKTMILMK